MRSIPKLLLGFATLSIGVAAQTLTTFAVNPKGGASPSALNDSGEVVGIYGCNETYCGFERDPGGKMHHLGLQVDPVAINGSGEFVGLFGQVSAFYSLPDGKLVKFLRGSQPYAAGVNAAGWIAGSYCTNCGLGKEEYFAFLMDPSGVISTFFSSPGAINVNGLNNLNQVVGNWAMSGFLYSNGKFDDSLNYPGAVATNPTAINDSGEIAGTWTDSVGFVHGFYWTAKAGFTSFDAIQHTTHTIPTCINASGLVAGFYWTKKGLGTASFTYDTTSGAITLLSIPHARFMNARGINAQGTVVGSYQVGTAQTRGFLYQP
jgi:probable HAF family extracellular repeat protein